MENLFPSQFFCCTSENCASFTSHLYGYGIFGNRIIINEDSQINMDLWDLRNSPGSFIYMERKGSELRLIPDINGFAPLFYYQEDKYWAVSNSFYLLVGILKGVGKKLTLDRGYAACMLYNKWTPLLYTESLATEIKLLPPETTFNIDIISKHILQIRNIATQDIQANSEFGIQYIDKWINKWINIYTSLYSSGFCIMQELTGGFDSRLAFVPMLASDVKLERLNIKSDDCKDDREKAQLVAKQCGTVVNSNPVIRPMISQRYYRNIFNYSRWGVHGSPLEPRNATTIYFRITGYCGESVRAKEGFDTAENFINTWYKDRWGKNIATEARATYLKAHNQALADYLSSDTRYDKEVSAILYRIHRTRIHDGSAMSMLLMTNALTLAPLADGMLHRLDLKNAPSRDLFYALVMERAGRKIRGIPYNNGKKLDPTAVELAAWLSARFPYRPQPVRPDKLVMQTPRQKVYDFPKGETDAHELAKEEYAKARAAFISAYPEKIIEETRPWRGLHTDAMNCAAAIGHLVDVPVVSSQAGEEREVSSHAEGGITKARPAPIPAIGESGVPAELEEEEYKRKTAPPHIFLYITSENCREFKNTHIYGYAIWENKWLINQDLPEAPIFTPDDVQGTCVILDCDQYPYLRLFTDKSGYGILYLYRHGDFWAISNSYGHLLDNLRREDRPLTLDENFAAHSLCALWTPFSGGATLCTEIALVPPKMEIRINTADNTLILIDDEPVHLVSIKSMQGVTLVDCWINKWASVIRSINDAGMPLQQDLSGGYDSRLPFTLTMASGININSININNSAAKTHDDYLIGSLIAQRLGFELNANKLHTYVISYKDAARMFHLARKYSHITTLGDRVWTERVIRLTGFGGEMYRGSWDITPEKHIGWMPPRYGQTLIEMSRQNMERGLEVLSHLSQSKEFTPKVNSLKILDKISRFRWHFGGNSFETMLKNGITLNPLADPMLDALHQDDACDYDFFFAFVHTRIAKSILDIGFDKHRAFSPEVLAEAAELDKKYPFRPVIRERAISGWNSEPVMRWPRKPTAEASFDILRRQEMEKVAHIFCRHYPELIVNDVRNSASTLGTNLENILAITEFLA